ncbi:MAG: hypothetical protein VKO64_00480 [Candidatus Sericytochromatia bacterium]|nr:hypothetical protein [Candidatus Sericytochromatia bacterium]
MRRGRGDQGGQPQGPPAQGVPQRVQPQQLTRPINPDNVGDARIGPGDSVVQAAYARTQAGTSDLMPGPRTPPEIGDRTDALMLRKTAKWARSITFTVQGITWRAGFAPDLVMTPVGQATPFRQLAEQEAHAPTGAILRPVGLDHELVFRALVPPHLLEQAAQMFGEPPRLERIALYYFPSGEGATAGIVASYGLQATSRPHVLYLQTSIRQPSPTVLDQIAKTFEAAIPRAREAAARPATGTFGEELGKAMTRVEASLRNSGMARRARAARVGAWQWSQLAGQGVDQAVGAFDRMVLAIMGLGRLPARLGIGIVRALSGALVRTIESVDKPGPPGGR